MKYDAVVVANGSGTRAELGFNKVFFIMKNNKTVLENACNVFVNDKDCEHIIIVTDEQDKVFKNEKIILVNGGSKRFNSVKNGIVKATNEYVFIHDAARPFLKAEDNDKLKEALKSYDGALLVSKIVNTIKFVEDGIVKKTLNRDLIYNALTPQAFKTSLLIEAYNIVALEDITDDSMVFEKMGYKVKAVEGDPKNIKLTTRKDFENI